MLRDLQIPSDSFELQGLWTCDLCRRGHLILTDFLMMIAQIKEKSTKFGDIHLSQKVMITAHSRFKNFSMDGESSGHLFCKQ